MNFQIYDDIEVIRLLLNLSIEEFAEAVEISKRTIYRWKNKETMISSSNLNNIYDFAFNHGIRLNQIKEQLFREECTDSVKVVLFHGAKTIIEGPLSIEKSKASNDFGKGFYCGESLEQSAMFVSGYPNSSLYILEFDKSNLTHIKFNVDRDWMLTIAYFRNKLTEYADAPNIKELINKIQNADYIIAPIADNRMFEIIDDFIDGNITDIQCQHCLSATNLGYQYVFTTQKALDQVKILRHCYLCNAEKHFYLNERLAETKTGNDKVKLAKRQYRGQGKYIEELFE